MRFYSSLFISFLLLANYSLSGQESLEVIGYVDARVYVSDQRLPFWMHTNTQGFIGQTSDYGVSAFAKAVYDVTPTQTVTIGLGGFLSNGLQDQLRRSDLYLEYQNSWITATLGSQSNPNISKSLSTINNNILFTGNTRALPGLLLKNTKPVRLFKNVSADAEIAHYLLNDQRLTNGARVHYKMLAFNWDINSKNSLRVGLRHYVQWAGTMSDGTQLPSDLNAFVRVFIGASGGAIDNNNEAINALGNHIGSYQIAYKVDTNSGVLDLYHQTIFEDRSGRELNNFPDGVWGVQFSPLKNTIFKQFVYEYIQTISQSGRPRDTSTPLGQQSGGDNYFINGIYPSGWTYEGNIIGLPLINPLGSLTTPSNNRMVGHHVGVLGALGKLDFTIKTTFVRNLGTFSEAITPAQKGIYFYNQWSYETKKLGSFSMYAGLDYLNDFENTASVGLGYRYELR